MLAGSFNVLQNLLVIILASTTLPTSVTYPVLAVGYLALTSLGAKLFFKERLSLKQWIGLAVGAAAVVVLSI